MYSIVIAALLLFPWSAVIVIAFGTLRAARRRAIASKRTQEGSVMKRSGTISWEGKDSLVSTSARWRGRETKMVRHVAVAVVGIGWLLVLEGCSVGMALGKKELPNALATIRPGSTRKEVQRELGRPKLSRTQTDGSRTDTYKYYEPDRYPPSHLLGTYPMGVSQAPRERAAWHAVWLVATLGMAEPLLVAEELWRSYTESRYTLTLLYGPDGSLVKVDGPVLTFRSAS